MTRQMYTAVFQEICPHRQAEPCPERVLGANCIETETLKWVRPSRKKEILETRGKIQRRACGDPRHSDATHKTTPLSATLPAVKC